MRLIDVDAMEKSMNDLVQGDIRQYPYSDTTWDMAFRLIDQQPTIEPKTGRWEYKPDPYGFFDSIPVCSECGCTTKMRETYSYCPTCGAKMKGEEG